MEQVELLTVRVATALNFNESDIDDLSISVTEMFNNAIHHGNAHDESKSVTLTFRQLPNQLEISIKDCGSGFNPDEIRDPLAPENLLAENGRGIYLVRNLMDDLQFNITSDGTEVLLRKNLP